MANYTKEEWVRDQMNRVCVFVPVVNDQGQKVGVACRYIAIPDPDSSLLLGCDEAEANSHLITAAPDMYEALNGMTAFRHNVPVDGTPQDARNKIIAMNKALAEAEGKIQEEVAK